MHIITILIATLAAFASARPAGDAKELAKKNWYIYATFYDDHACTKNKGIAVSTANPGCLANEYNRHSIYFQQGFQPQNHNLITSPGPHCNCQNACIEAIDKRAASEAYCHDLAGHPVARSYRFIYDNAGCPQNQCQ